MSEYGAVLALLDGLHECQSRLYDFANDLLVWSDFAGDVELDHSFLIGPVEGGGMEVKLAHHFGIRPGSEVYLVVSVRVFDTFCVADTTVRADLGEHLGRLGPGAHTLYATGGDAIALADVVKALHAEVDALTGAGNPLAPLTP
ncbi:hypothetical protein [Spirillospora sp. NPDC047279]|uniref:hypothetical protein n=1 Tax=Spirillospora sp. NPDC047279 TaxID=3155478 RepID=UPI0033EE378B